MNFLFDCSAGKREPLKREYLEQLKKQLRSGIKRTTSSVMLDGSIPVDEMRKGWREGIIL